MPQCCIKIFIVIALFFIADLVDRSLGSKSGIKEGASGFNTDVLFDEFLASLGKLIGIVEVNSKLFGQVLKLRTQRFFAVAIVWQWRFLAASAAGPRFKVTQRFAPVPQPPQANLRR